MTTGTDCTDYTPNWNNWFLLKHAKEVNCGCVEKRIGDLEHWDTELQKPFWYPDSYNTKVKRSSIRNTINYLREAVALAAV